MFGQCGGAEIEDGLTGGVPMPMPVPCKTFFLSQSTFGCGADGGGGGGLEVFSDCFLLCRNLLTLALPLYVS